MLAGVCWPSVARRVASHCAPACAIASAALKTRLFANSSPITHPADHMSAALPCLHTSLFSDDHRRTFPTNRVTFHVLIIIPVLYTIMLQQQHSFFSILKHLLYFSYKIQFLKTNNFFLLNYQTKLFPISYCKGNVLAQPKSQSLILDFASIKIFFGYSTKLLSKKKKPP
jgi:hypothetical protein